MVVIRRPLLWLGSAREDLRAFPAPARRKAGHQLDLLQQGLQPADWKPMSTVGDGVYEIRIRAKGAFRVFYAAKFEEGIVVIHAFQKKSRQTGSFDLAIVSKRYRAFLAQRHQRKEG